MSKRLIFAHIALVLLLLAPALPQRVHATIPIPSITWVRTWGGSGTDFAYCLQRDSSGNLYTVGPTNSFAGGSYKTFILKYNSSGGLLWQKIWGTLNADDKANPCGMDSSGNLYVAGYTQAVGNDCYAWPSYGSCTVTLLKLDSSGNILWEKNWGGNASNVPHGVVVDSFGNVYVSGFFETSGLGGGISHAFLLKFNSTGSLVWQRSWGGLRDDDGNGLGNDLAGNVYLTGYTKSFGDGSGDIFLLKISPDGNILWERAWGLSGFDEGVGVATDGSDNVYVTGRSGSFKTGGAGGGDVVLLKYNSSGSLQLQRVWGPTGSSVVDSSGGNLAIDSARNIFITGGTGSSPFDPTTWDLLFLEFDSHGKLLQQNSFGAVGNDGAGELKLDDAGSLYISGHVSEGPPYYLTTLNYSSFSPALSSGTPTIPLQTLTYPATTLNGNITTVTGTPTYGGGMDALLLKSTTGGPSPTFPAFTVDLILLPIVAILLYITRHKGPGSRTMSES